jgi:hypothetical protein
LPVEPSKGNEGRGIFLFAGDVNRYGKRHGRGRKKNSMMRRYAKKDEGL